MRRRAGIAVPMLLRRHTGGACGARPEMVLAGGRGSATVNIGPSHPAFVSAVHWWLALVPARRASTAQKSVLGALEMRGPRASAEPVDFAPHQTHAYDIVLNRANKGSHRHRTHTRTFADTRARPRTSSRTLSRTLFFNPGRDIEYRLGNDLFRVMLGLQRSFFANRKVGELVSIATNDMQSVRLLVGFAGLQIFNVAVAVPLHIWQMYTLDPLLTACAAFVELPDGSKAPGFYREGDRCVACRAQRLGYGACVPAPVGRSS